MDWIVIAIMATIIVSLTTLALWYAKKEDDELADMRRRLMALENEENEENDENEDDENEH